MQGSIVTHLKKKIIMYPTEVLKFILASTMFLTRSNCLSVTDIFGTYLDDNSTDEVKKSDIEVGYLKTTSIDFVTCDNIIQLINNLINYEE